MSVEKYRQVADLFRRHGMHISDQHLLYHWLMAEAFGEERKDVTSDTVERIIGPRAAAMHREHQRTSE